MSCALAFLSCGNFLFAQSKSTVGPLDSRLAGRIFDTDGNPIPDAVVMCETAATPGRRELPIVEVRSGLDGSFTLTTGPATGVSRYLWICAPGYGVQFHHAAEFLMTDETPTPKRVTLNVPAPVRLRLTAPDGRPQASELIEPEIISFSSKTAAVPQRLREVLGGLSDADGFLQINFLDRSSSTNVRVVSEAFGIQSRQTHFGRAGGEWQLKLSPVGAITGRIVANDPAAFAGRTIKVQSTLRIPEDELLVGGLPGGPAVDFDKGEATTQIDREGRFQIPAILAGAISVTLTNPPQSDWVTEISQTFNLQPGKTRDVEIAAVQKVSFQGTVLLSDGTPASGVEVKLSSGPRWPTAAATTNSEGVFRCAVCPGDVELKANLLIYQGVTVFHQSATVISVTSGVSADPSTAVAKPVRLPELKLVEGTVVDASGKGMPNVPLEIWQQPRVQEALVTDSNGRFRIYRTDQAQFNQFSVKSKVTLADPGEPLVIRVRE